MHIRQKLKRGRILAAVGLLLFTLLVPVFPAGKASAESLLPEPEVDKNLLANAEIHNEYYWLRACFYSYDIDSISTGEMDAWDWFEGTKRDENIIGSMFGPGKDATWSCETEANIKRVMNHLGFDDPVDSFCSMHFTAKFKSDFGSDTKYDTHEACVGTDDGRSDYHYDMSGSKSDQGKAFEGLIKGDYTKESPAKSSAPDAVKLAINALDQPTEYVRQFTSFWHACGNPIEVVDESFSSGDADADNKYQTPYVTPDTIKEDPQNLVKYVVTKGYSSASYQVAIVAQKDVNTGTEYKYGDKDSVLTNDLWPRGEVVSCNEASKRLRGEGSGEYAGKNLALAYAQWLKANPGLYEGTTVNSNQDGGGSADPHGCTSLGNPLSWFLCPVIEILSGLVNVLDNMIEGLLHIDQDTYQSDTIRQLWQVMRNIAFMILVPMMILMVIGTAIEFGPFDAYTVRKALPRMLVAVIFIPLSLPICYFFIKISNVIGQDIGNIIVSIAQSAGVQMASLRDLYGATSAALTTTVGALAVTGAFALGWLTWGIVGSLALVTVVGLLIGYFILVLRQLLILVLMFMAPLAIIVWIFPGNDKLWKIWRSTFTALLMMYPLIVLLIYSGKLFAGIINVQGGGIAEFALKTIAYVLPYFLIPATFKYGLGVFGNLAGIINDKSRGFFDKQRKFREGSAAKAKERSALGARFRGAKEGSLGGRLNKFGGAAHNLGASLEAGGFGRDPRNWGRRLATNQAVTLGERREQAFARAMKEDPFYNAWKGNGNLGKLVNGSQNEADLRARIAAAEATGQKLFESDRDREEAINAVERNRQAYGNTVLNRLGAQSFAGDGTAYTDVGEAWAEVAKSVEGDYLAKSAAIQTTRNSMMSGGRSDGGGAGWGQSWTQLNRLEKANQKLQQGEITQAQYDAEVKAAGKAIRKDSREGQGSVNLVHSSVKVQAVQAQAPEMLEDLQQALLTNQAETVEVNGKQVAQTNAVERRAELHTERGQIEEALKVAQESGDQAGVAQRTNELRTIDDTISRVDREFMRELAKVDGVHGALNMSSPNKADIIASEVLDQELDWNTLPLSIQDKLRPVFSTQVAGPDGKMTAQFVEPERVKVSQVVTAAKYDSQFQQFSKQYNTEIEEAQRAMPRPPGDSPGGIPDPRNIPSL